jgi:hypothetical protein
MLGKTKKPTNVAMPVCIIIFGIAAAVLSLKKSTKILLFASSYEALPTPAMQYIITSWGTVKSRTSCWEGREGRERRGERGGEREEGREGGREGERRGGGSPTEWGEHKYWCWGSLHHNLNTISTLSLRYLYTMRECHLKEERECDTHECNGSDAQHEGLATDADDAGGDERDEGADASREGGEVPDVVLAGG